jgi:hypothetical protein
VTARYWVGLALARFHAAHCSEYAKANDRKNHQVPRLDRERHRVPRSMAEYGTRRQVTTPIVLGYPFGDRCTANEFIRSAPVPPRRRTSWLLLLPRNALTRLAAACLPPMRSTAAPTVKVSPKRSRSCAPADTRAVRWARRAPRKAHRELRRGWILAHLWRICGAWAQAEPATPSARARLNSAARFAVRMPVDAWAPRLSRGE